MWIRTTIINLRSLCPMIIIVTCCKNHTYLLLGKQYNYPVRRYHQMLLLDLVMSFSNLSEYRSTSFLYCNLPFQSLFFLSREILACLELLTIYKDLIWTIDRYLDLPYPETHCNYTCVNNNIITYLQPVPISSFPLGITASTGTSRK